MTDDKSDLIYEAVILVTRGDERPKKNYQTKKHPTYETSIRIKGPKGSNVRSTSHVVCKFFDQYRELHEKLEGMGIGEDKKIPINAPFPPTLTTSALGFQMTEDQLQARCYKLNKWMQAVFGIFHTLPEEAQTELSQFISLEDADAASEANKELILTILKRKNDLSNLGPGPSNGQSVSRNVNNNNTNVNPNTSHVGNTTDVKGSTPNSNNSVNVPTKSPEPSPVSSSVPSSGNAITAPVVVRQPNKVDAAKSSQPPEPADSKRLSTPQSTISETHQVYSSAELGEYSKETIINGVLAVSILKGEMVAKSAEDTKLHQSYEVILRILPFAETAAANDPEVDKLQYQNIAGIPPIMIGYPFDRYRTLKQDLETAGVFTKENIRGLNDFNDRSSKLYPAGSNPVMGIRLDCDFPRTYKRSSLGLALLEEQLAERVALLNNWLGHVMRAFSKFSPNAQSLVIDFLGLTVRDAHVNDLDISSQLNLQDQVVVSKIFLAMLKNKFVAPKIKPPEAPPSKKDKKKEKEKEKEKKADESVSEVTTVEAVVLTEGVNDAVMVSSLPESTPEKKRVPQERPDGKSEISTISAVAMTPQKINEFSKETILYSFLGVKVTKGDMVAKDKDEKKRHQGYETVVRILPFTEIVYNDKHKVDQFAYTKVQSSMGNISVTYVFDEYRKLKMNLEKKSIYCHDFVPAGTNLNNNGVILLEASFPSTHRRSSLGLGLTDAQILNRTAQLNRWIGALLSKFHLYSADVQEEICDFLHLEEDDPTQPQGKTMISMLRRKYVPPMTVVVVQSASAPIERKRPADENNGNSVSSYGYSKGAPKRPNDDDVDDDDRPRGDGHVAAGNACCIIM